MEQFPYTNFHELNLDWIIALIRRLSKIYDGVEDKIEEIVYKYLEQMLEDGDLKELIDQILNEITERLGTFPVSPEMFGAKGDGTANDTIAFQNCIDYANENNTDIKCEYNKKYLITPSELLVNTSIDFSNSTVIPTSEGTLFIYKDPTAEEFTFDESSLQYNRVTKTELYNKVMTVISPFSLGTRINTETLTYHTQTLTTDDRGYFIDGNYTPEIITGNYKFSNVHAIKQTRYFKNINIDYSRTQVCTLLEIRDSNVKIDNVTISNYSAVNTTRSFIFVSMCTSVEISNVNCHNVGTINDSSYVIGNYCSNNLYIHDCSFIDVQGQSWGSFGFSFAGTTTIERVTTNRTDCHYELCGNYTVRDCNLQFATYCGGFGNFIFDNCIFLTTTSQYTVDSRADLNNPLSGFIKVVNCSSYNVANTFFRYYIRGTFANLKNYNYINTDIILKDLKTYSKTKNLVLALASADATIASKTSLTIDNIIDQELSFNINSADNNQLNNKFKTIKICNLVDIEFYPSGLKCNTLIIDNVDINDKAIVTATDKQDPMQDNLIVSNCVLGGFTYLTKVGAFCITGNIIRGNRTFTAADGVNGIVASNYCADNTTYQEVWNRGLYRSV